MNALWENGRIVEIAVVFAVKGEGVGIGIDESRSAHEADIVQGDKAGVKQSRGIFLFLSFTTGESSVSGIGMKFLRNCSRRARYGRKLA